MKKSFPSSSSYLRWLKASLSISAYCRFIIIGLVSMNCLVPLGLLAQGGKPNNPAQSKSLASPSSSNTKAAVKSTSPAPTQPSTPLKSGTNTSNTVPRQSSNSSSAAKQPMKTTYDNTETRQSEPVTTQAAPQYNYESAQFFVGNWVNVDTSSDCVEGITVSRNYYQLAFQVLGVCDSSDCDWGVQQVEELSATDRVVEISWKVGNATHVQNIRHLPMQDELYVVTATSSIDSNGRMNTITRTDKLRRSYGSTQRRMSLGQNSTSGFAGIEFEAFYINLGYRRWQLEGRNVEFFMFDDSPTPDAINEDVTLNRSGFSFDIGLEFAKNKLHFGGGYHGFLGKISGQAFEPMVGYCLLDKDKIKLRPGLSMYFGRGSINLGSIENTSTYIQINSQRYYDGGVTVSMRRPITTVNPHLVVDVPIRGKSRWIRAKLGYSLQLVGGEEKLRFSGTVNDETVVEYKPFSSSEYFFVDGHRNDRLPARFSGVFFQLGYVIR